MNEPVRGSSFRAALAFGMFFALCAPLLTRPLTHDEIYYSSAYFTGIAAATNGEAAARPYERWDTDWSRQLAIHPPGLYWFYRAWTEIFGDSPAAMRIPPLAAGAALIFIVLVGGADAFGAQAASAAALLIACSPAYSEYSARAVPAIFEALVCVMTLLALRAVLGRPRAARAAALALVNVAGLLLFYHYAVVLSAQSVALWSARRRCRAFTPLAAASALSVIFLAVFIAANAAQGNYAHSWWMPPTVMNLVRAIVRLPIRVEG